MKYSLQDVMDDLANCHDNDAYKKLVILEKELREILREIEAPLEENGVLHSKGDILREILGDASGRTDKEHRCFT